MRYSRNMPKWKKIKAREMRKNPTPAERLLWKLLRCKKLGVRFRRQHPLLGFIADFYCPGKRLIVEADGNLHDLQKDSIRDNIMRSHGIKTLRFSNSEIINSPHRVIKKIYKNL